MWKYLRKAGNFPKPRPRVSWAEGTRYTKSGKYIIEAGKTVTYGNNRRKSLIDTMEARSEKDVSLREHLPLPGSEERAT